MAITSEVLVTDKNVAEFLEAKKAFENASVKTFSIRKDILKRLAEKLSLQEVALATIAEKHLDETYFALPNPSAARKINKILNNSSVSFEAKLYMAFSYPNHRTIQDWALKNLNGSTFFNFLLISNVYYIATIDEYRATQLQDPLVMHALFTKSRHATDSGLQMYFATKTFANIITSDSLQVSTLDFLATHINSSNKKNWATALDRNELAAACRKFWDFDADLPAKWVLEAAGFGELVNN